MNTFTLHIPAFVDYRDPHPKMEFETTAELLALEPLRQYAAEPGFSNFALSDHAVLGISDDGHYWWVLGHVADLRGVDLPAWDHGVYRLSIEGGHAQDVSGRLVRSSCGDDVELKDGRKARWVR